MNMIINKIFSTNFVLMILVIFPWNVDAHGKITSLIITESLENSLQIELSVAPRDPEEETTYRALIKVEDLEIEEQEDRTMFCMIANKLAPSIADFSPLKKNKFFKDVKIEKLEGAVHVGEERTNDQGRVYLSTIFKLQCNGELTCRLGEVERIEEVGEPLKIRFWLHLEELTKNIQPTSDEWTKYLTVSRRQAEPPFPVLANTLEMEERRRELLRSVSHLRADQYVTAIHGLVHLDAAEAMEMVKNQLSPDGKIKASLSRDQLIVTDQRNYVLNILQTLEALDHQAPEVSIEVKIVEINRGAEKELGVNWSGQKGGRYGGSVSSLTSGASPENPLGWVNPQGLFEGTILKGTDELTMRISALLQKGLGKVMSEPKLLVANRETGEFRMTEKTPVMVRNKLVIKDAVELRMEDRGKNYLDNSNRTEVKAGQTQFPNSSDGTGYLVDKKTSNYTLNENNVYTESKNGSSSDIYRTGSSQRNGETTWQEVMIETGIVLKVTPQIRQSGVIELELNPTITEWSSLPSQTDTPVISTREIKTKAYVRDGETLVLGGLMYEKQTSKSSDIPFLSKIPGLGVLFRHRTEKNTQTELLFLVKTRIVQL
jgi:Flp pilus assembly secretin CpaC